MTQARIALVVSGAGGIGPELSRVLAREGGHVVVADIDIVRVEQTVADLFESVEMEVGPVATLVYVAGGALVEGGARPLIATMTLDTWIETEALNVRGAFLCVREFLRRRMGAAVTDGRIVAVASMGALQPGAAVSAAHATSEAGVLAITRIAALEAGPMGITVNAILSGRSDTLASDVAEAVSFLSSVDARHITGAAIAVDGGLHLNL